jgi:hypothetical protein
MSEERAGRPGSSRGSAEPPELDVQELSAALQRSVAAIGAGGPPRAGLTRIRKRAKARQRRRTVVAGSAGVLMLAMVVGAVTGSKFDIVPVLTGVVGLGGNSSSSSGAASATPHAGGSGQVRTVRPPAAVAGKKGPAIGPVLPTASPTALASAGLPQCTASDLKTTTTVDSVINGVSYGHVDAVANTACAVAGPPVLQVQNVAGTAVSSVVILQHESTDGSQLPNVSTWGAVLKLQAGQGYDLQFAWAADECPAVLTPSAGSSGSASPTVAAGPNQNPESEYSLSYLVAGVAPTAPVDLEASCGATVYVTDVYKQGAYALPQPPASPTPQASTTSAPAPTQAPTTQPPTTGAPSTAATSPTASDSGSAASSGGDATTSSAATGGAANATAIPSAS